MRYAHAFRFVVDLVGTQKSMPIVIYDTFKWNASQTKPSLTKPSLIIVVDYRPPSSLNSDVEDIITRITQCFNEMPTPMPNIVVVDHFNFPKNFNWDGPNTDYIISKVMIASFY